MSDPIRIRHHQMDGLRFVAAFLVMLQHWLFNPTGIRAPAGLCGVTLFFVISGYLITTILLESRESIEQHGASRLHHLKTFYVRRCLRIFPLYYLVVFILLAIGVQSAHDSAAWLLTYTINLKFALIGGYEPVISHFWSLAIEEQFYLIYPLLMLLWPARRLHHLFVWFIALGVLSRALGFASGITDRSNTFITFTCFDALGCGGALAYLYRYHQAWFQAVTRWSMLTGLLVIGACCTLIWVRFGDTGSYRVIWLRLLISLVTCWLVGRVVIGFRGPVGALLSHRAVTYLGTISYGMYVYHNILPYGLQLAGVDALPLPARFALYFVATVIVSMASWHLFEWPINRLKTRFFY